MLVPTELVSLACLWWPIVKFENTTGLLWLTVKFICTAVMDSYGHVCFTALLFLFCYYYPWVSAPVCLYAYIYPYIWICVWERQSVWAVVFGCDCSGTIDVYFQKYFLWMKTKTWVCELMDQIAGSYKRWMNADSLTDTDHRGCFILSFHHPHMTHYYIPILPLYRINLVYTGYILHYFY